MPRNCRGGRRQRRQSPAIRRGNITIIHITILYIEGLVHIEGRGEGGGGAGEARDQQSRGPGRAVMITHDRERPYTRACIHMHTHNPVARVNTH